MPEKSIGELSRAWRDQYEKGRVAFEKSNMDYAITIFTQILEKEPAFFECRQALRASQFKRAGTGGSGFFKKMLGSANPRLMQAQMHLRNNPQEALSDVEQVLNTDPNNLAAHKILADAAIAADFPKTAILSLEIVYKQAPRDRDVAYKLATTLVKSGQAARGEAIMSELVRQYPEDMEMFQALKDLSANRTLKEAGYEKLEGGQGSYRDVLKDEKQSVSLEQEHREHKSEDVNRKLIGEYEAKLIQEPTNFRLIRSIAELYAKINEFDRSLEYYQRLTSTEAADPSLERAMTDLKVRKLDHVMAQLDPNTADYAAQAAQLKKEKQAFVLADARARAERYPNDLQLRFELGQLYLQAGRIGEAIQEFQKAQNNPHRRIASLFHLGQCFFQRGMNDLAVRTFQNALKEKVGFDDERKELIYALGCAFDKMGKKEEAMEQFKLIYEVDIGYRDVGTRVDAYYSGGDASAQGSP